MRRLRWYSVGGAGFQLQPLGARCLADEYSARKRAGFVLDERTRTRISGSFVEAFDVEEEVHDPFGRVTRYSRVDYRRVRFSLGSGVANLELENPPRSTKEFFGRLSSMADFGLFVEAVRPDVLKWLKAIEGRLGRVRVTSMSVSAAPLAGSVRADVIVTGTGDVRRELASFVGGRGTIVALEFEWRQKESDTRLTCELTSAGANIPEEWDGVSVGHVREALRSQIEQLGAA